MPQAVVNVIAGRYTSAWTPQGGGGALSLGVLADDGWEIGLTIKGQEVNATDAFGLSLVEIIYRGADWRIRARAMEYVQAFAQVWWPWGASVANPLETHMGIVGRKGSQSAGSMVWTAAPGTPAAAAGANGPAGLTAGMCISALNYTSTMLFTSKVREVPFELVFLPYDIGGGVIGWFTMA